MNRAKFTCLGIIILVAFSLRAAFILKFKPPLSGDSRQYIQLARSLAQNNCFCNEHGLPTAVRPPVYPFFLFLISCIFGRNLMAVLFIQALIDTASCLLIFYLARKAFSEKAGLIAVSIAAIHFGFISYSAQILTETLSSFLLIASMLIFCAALELRRVALLSLSAVILGLAALTRSNLLMVAPFVAGYMAIGLKRAGEGKWIILKNILAYLLSFLLVLIPWTVRNYRAFGALVPISSAGGIALYTSYRPIQDKIYGFTPHDEITRKAKTLPTEVRQSEFLKKETLRLLRSNPKLTVKYLGLKLAYLFSPFDWELIRGLAVYNFSYVFFAAFFIAGLFIFLRRIAGFGFIFAPLLATVFTSAILFGIPRFRLPVEPLMIIFASGAIDELYKRAKIKRYFIITVILFFLLNLAFYVYSEEAKELGRAILKSAGLW